MEVISFAPYFSFSWRNDVVPFRCIHVLEQSKCVHSSGKQGLLERSFNSSLLDTSPPFSCDFSLQSVGWGGQDPKTHDDTWWHTMTHDGTWSRFGSTDFSRNSATSLAACLNHAVIKPLNCTDCAIERRSTLQIFKCTDRSSIGIFGFAKFRHGRRKIWCDKYEQILWWKSKYEYKNINQYYMRSFEY